MNEAIETLLAEGSQARRRGHLAEARELYERAVALSRQASTPNLLVPSLKGVGQILRDQGNREEALQQYTEASSVCRTLNDRLALAHTIRHVADIQRELKMNIEADSNYKEALSIYRSDPGTNTLDLANALRGYAVLQSNLGIKDEAVALWQEASFLYDQVWREPGSPYTEADLAPGIAECQRQLSILALR